MEKYQLKKIITVDTPVMIYIRIFLIDINSQVNFVMSVCPYENVDRGDYETNMKKCQNIKYIYYPHSHFTIKVANLSFKFQPKRITNTEEYKGSSS